MPRLRTIKPGFFSNEILADLPPLARLLFAGLWCWADREGRLEDRPRRIKADILPYDDCDCDRLLDALAGAGFLSRYEVDGARYVQIVNFVKHQQPHYKEAASEIPPPSGHVDSPVITFGVSPEQRKRIMERDGHKCVICGSSERLTIDHIMPRSRGGSGDDENLRVLCNRCNTTKGNHEAKAAVDEQTKLASNSPQTRPDESGASPTVFGIRSLGSGLWDQGSIDPTTAVVGANAPTPTLGKADDSEVFSDTVKRLPRGKAARAMAVQLEVNLRQEYGDEWVDAAGENAIRLGKVDNRGSPIIGYVEGTCRGWVADGFKPPGGKPWERETRGDNGRGSTQNDPTASARRSNSNRRESEYANIAVTRIDTTPR